MRLGADCYRFHFYTGWTLPGWYWFRQRPWYWLRPRAEVVCNRKRVSVYIRLLGFFFKAEYDVGNNWPGLLVYGAFK